MGLQANLVVSVPHSGTRTLCAHLGLDVHEHFWYTGRKYRPHSPEQVNVAVRHPMSVAESWARRGKDVRQLLARYEAMFEFVEWAKDAPTYYQIERLPRLAGLGDHDRKEVVRPEVIEYYQARVMAEVASIHMGFYTNMGYEL